MCNTDFHLVGKKFVIGSFNLSFLSLVKSILRSLGSYSVVGTAQQVFEWGAKEECENKWENNWGYYIKLDRNTVHVFYFLSINLKWFLPVKVATY